MQVAPKTKEEKQKKIRVQLILDGDSQKRNEENGELHTMQTQSKKPQ